MYEKTMVWNLRYCYENYGLFILWKNGYMNAYNLKLVNQCIKSPQIVTHRHQALLVDIFFNLLAY